MTRGRALGPRDKRGATTREKEKMSELLTPYPDITPYETGMMDTGDGHSLYWEKSGNKNGAPVVFLHGGPGSGTLPRHRTLFNPEKYNIILFDQRGSGKSTPHASLENNTTPHLIKDIEQLRAKLGIKKWAVFGTSWGAALALAYADAHPQSLTALVVSGAYLSRDAELHDLYFEGGVVSRVFPDVFEPYIALLPPGQRANPLKGYQALFKSADAGARAAALDRWTRLEKKVSQLVVTDEELSADMADPAFVLAHSLLENHYWLHNSFMDGDRIARDIGEKTKNIPVHFVQGRYDMVCTFATAWELHKAVPHSRLHVIDNTGHAMREPKTTHTIIDIMNKLEVRP